MTLSAQIATVVAHAAAVGDSALTEQTTDLRDDACFPGVAGAPGIAIGSAVVIHPAANFDAVPEKEGENVMIELLLFDQTFESA